MTVITTSPAWEGRFTKLAHAIFVCVSLLRLCGLLYIIVGTVMIVKDGVLQHATFPLLNQFVVNGMPLGNLSSGLVYGLFFMLALHTVFGCVGLMGVACHSRLLIIIYTCFLMFGVVMDAIFILLFSLILSAINSWIKDRFLAYYDDSSTVPTRLNAEVDNAFKELFDAMNCIAAVGTKESGPGCWDKYYPVMNGTLRVFILLLSFSIVLEITTIVLLEIVYRRVGQPKYKRAPGMYTQCFQFLRTSFSTNKKKCCFAVIQFTDVVCSAMLVIGGIVISQSRFVTDSRLLPIFENLRFNNYYLPDIIIGLAITMILIGCFNSVSCGLGCNMLCFNSSNSTRKKASLTWQVVMVILIFIGLTFWINLLVAVYYDMVHQLYYEFLVYGGTAQIQQYYTRAWNALFVTYSCCSVGVIRTFDDTPYFTEGRWYQSFTVPTYCRSGASIANSDQDTITIPPIITSESYYTTVCETPLKAEVREYSIYFGVVCGIAFVIKVFNIFYLYKYGFEEVSVNQEASTWEAVKDYIKENRCLVLGLALFTVLGLLMSWGILITGSRLYFDDILGHKDIKVLFEYIYISGRDVTSWIAIMSNVLISIGSVSFVFFCVGIVSVFLGVARMYYVAVLALVTSLVFKLISILLWIPLRVSFDWNLRKEMYSAVHAYYVTDNTQSGADLYIGDKNLGLNTLFYQGKCCLLQSSVFDTIYTRYGTSRMWKRWPWTCAPCSYDRGVRWPYLWDNRYSSTNSLGCPSASASAYTEDCTTTILDSTLHRYDTTAVVFSVVMILLEVALIIVLDRVYKARVDPGQVRGLFSNLFLNNRFINDTNMPKFKNIAFGLCFVMSVSLILEILVTVGIIMEKIEPGYFDSIEQLFLNDVFAGDISLGYVTHALGVLLLTMTLISVVLNVITIVAVLRKWRHVLFAFSFVTILFGACNAVIIGLLCQVLDVAYCCDKSPGCSYRTDTDSDTFQQFCNQVYHNSIHKVIGISIAYVISMLVLQVVCLVLSDRLYKRIQSRPEKEASGIFTTVWNAATNNRFINQTRMPNYTNLVAVFMSWKGITLVSEVVVSIGIILQKFSPNYFYTTETVYLNNIYSGDLTLGYVTYVTGIVMFCVVILSVVLGVLGVVAVFKGWRPVMCVIVIPTLLLMMTEMICLGLLSPVLSVAYCCDKGSACDYHVSGTIPSIEHLCRQGFQGAVFNVIGTFIGFIVAHLVVQVVALCLADRIYKRMSTKDAADKPPPGMFQHILLSMVDNRFINQDRMPNYTTLVAVLMSLKGITMVSEVVVSIGIILQKFSPNYFYTTETVYLNNIYSGDLTLGYVTHVTGIVMFCVVILSVVFGVLGVVAVFKGWKPVMCVVFILTLVLAIAELICLGLLSLVLSVAYCCDYGTNCTFSLHNGISFENICRQGFQGAVFNVIGTFIGFIAAHLVAQVVAMGLADRIYQRISTKDNSTHGMVRSLIKPIVNNRCINQEKMPNFTLMTLLYVAGTVLMSVIDISAWIAILLLVIRGDSQLDEMYVGTVYLSEMTREASITLLVVIPIMLAFNVCKVVWSLLKWNTGLRWSTLPETLRLIVDIVILGLYAQLLESIRLSDRNIYRVMYELILSYLCINIATQLVLFAIKDRLHKRIENSSSVTNPSGLISWLWKSVVSHRYFRTDSGKTKKAVLGFCFLSCCLVVWEISVWVAVLLQERTPGYLLGPFRAELSLVYDDDYLWRLLVTLLVVEWVYVIFHVLTVIAVIKQNHNKIALRGAAGLLVCILVSDLVTIGLASDWLDKAYNCSSPSKFCSTHVSKLYELCGVFIGLNTAHVCLISVLFGLCLYLAYIAASSMSTVRISPGEHVELQPSTQTDPENGAIPSRPENRPTSSVVDTVSSIADS